MSSEIDEKASTGSLMLIIVIQKIGKDAIRHHKKTKNEEVNCKLNDCFNDLVSIIAYPLYSLPKSFSKVV